MSRAVISGGSAVRDSSSSSSTRSTGAAGPSGSRPNSVNSRASCSSRPDSAFRTSIASDCAPSRRARELRDGEPNGCERIAHLVRHPARGLPKGAESLRLDLAGTAPLQSGPPSRAVPSEARRIRAPLGRSGRVEAASSLRMFPVQPISSSIGRLSWRERCPPSLHRRVQESGAHQQYRERQAGIVVAAERLGSLKPSDGGVERGGVGVEGFPLGRREPGRIEGFEQRASGSADLLERLARAERGRGRTDRPSPAENRQRGGQRAETDQDEEDTLMEGEPHRS